VQEHETPTTTKEDNIMSTIETTGTVWMFEANRRRREAEARELLAGYVEAGDAERDTLRAEWIDLLLSRQVIESDEHRAHLHEKHEAFMGKLDERLAAYEAEPGEETRTGLIKTYRSFVRRLVLPHHYLV
jgi:hypothetical protein